MVGAVNCGNAPVSCLFAILGTSQQTYKSFAQITNVEWSYSRKRHFREPIQSFSRRVETEKAGFCLRYFFGGERRVDFAKSDSKEGNKQREVFLSWKKILGQSC